MTSRDERTIRVSLALAVSRGCILCGGPADLAGMFLPFDSIAWGSRPGKQRMAAYGLCDPCHESRSLEEVEEFLARWRRAA